MPCVHVCVCVCVLRWNVKILMKEIKQFKQTAKGISTRCKVLLARNVGSHHLEQVIRIKVIIFTATSWLRLDIQCWRLMSFVYSWNCGLIATRLLTIQSKTTVPVCVFCLWHCVCVCVQAGLVCVMCVCVRVLGMYDRPLLVLFVNGSTGSQGEKGMWNHLTAELPAGVPLAASHTHTHTHSILCSDHCVVEKLPL